MIRSILEFLAILAFVAISMTANAHAMRVNDGIGHEEPAQITSLVALSADSGMILSCEDMGGPQCPFACNGVASTVSPVGLPCPCGYGALLFFATGVVELDRLAPDQLERPPRV